MNHLTGESIEREEQRTQARAWCVCQGEDRGQPNRLNAAADEVGATQETGVGAAGRQSFKKKANAAEQLKKMKIKMCWLTSSFI